MKASKYWRILWITLGWVLISQLLFYYAHTYMVSQVPKESLSLLPYQPGYTQLAYGLSSIVGGILFGYIMVMRKPTLSSFAEGIFRISVIYLVIFLSAVIGVTAVITFLTSSSDGLNLLLENIWGVITNTSLLISLITWGFIVAATYFLLQVSDMLGRGVLRNFITGKYFKPSEEERIFMFMDLKSSTKIAEHAGHKLYFTFVREVIKDVTQPILNHKGEIYQYVGDEIVISWKMNNGIANANCLKCFLEIKNLLLGRKEYYQEKFGAIPEFKAGLHHGLVTVGEIGVVKKDIVFSGDVLNTTSRIQEQCKVYHVDILISKETLSLIKDQVELSFKHLGHFELRGKEKSVELFTVG